MWQNIKDALPGRDSRAWLSMMAIGLVGYLLAKEIPPTQWGYADWLQFASAALMAFSGTAKSSPLPLKSEKPKE